MPDLLVTGATGFLGRHLCGELIRRGAAFRALVRPTSNIDHLNDECAKLVAGDLEDLESLERACDGCRRAIHLAAATDVTDAGVNRRVNVEGVRNLIAACRRAGLERVVFLSTTCAGRRRRDAYGETKREGEDLIRASGLQVTVLRPTMIYGEGSKEWETFVGAVRRLPVVPLIGSGKHVIRPVAVGDVVQAVVAALARDATAGKIYDIAGPTPITFDQLTEMVAQGVGKRRRVVHLPVPLALAAARILGRLTVHTLITADQVLAFDQDTEVDIGPARYDLDFDPRPIERGLSELFGKELRL